MTDIDRPVGLMAFVLVLAMYLGITWLAILVGVGAVFIFLSTVDLRRPQPVASAAPAKKEEEILSPVVVQDVGNSPYLYPPDFRLKVKPDWKAKNFLESSSMGAAFGFRALHNIFSGRSLARSGGKTRLRQ